jgi:hypothetical protein
MGLYERLAGTEEPKISVHAFMSAMGEWERGKIGQPALVSAFGLSAGAETEAVALAAKMGTVHEPHAMSGRVTLTNVGSAYDTNDDSKSLPFVYVQAAGVSRIDIELRVSKIGTGTQDWQLWDDTNGVEALGPGSITSGSLSDAGAAAHKTLNASRVFGSPLAPGIRKLRLRSKSSVATDDPVFLNAAILLFRTDTISAAVLHEVLLLGEAGLYTVAQVKSRLGIA